MKYTALFRGINVGGKNTVKMEDLKRLFSELGIPGAKTYIQSGNVIFESSLEEARLQDMIYTGFAEYFGFTGAVMLRNIDEIKMLIEQLPFSADEIAAAEAVDPHVEHLYIYFLDILRGQTDADRVCREYFGPDLLRMGNAEAYLLCHQSIRKSKLAVRAAHVFDRATVRNWKTVHKIYDMMLAL